MSRSIHISYQNAAGKAVTIDVPPPYFLLGTQKGSMDFWSRPRLKEIGIARLTMLGETDPVDFYGWEGMNVLGHEIELLAKNLQSVEYHLQSRAEWLSHLTFCYHLLLATTPRECTPIFSIG